MDIRTDHHQFVIAHAYASVCRTKLIVRLSVYSYVTIFPGRIYIEPEECGPIVVSVRYDGVVLIRRLVDRRQGSVAGGCPYDIIPLGCLVVARNTLAFFCYPPPSCSCQIYARPAESSQSEGRR